MTIRRTLPGALLLTALVLQAATSAAWQPACDETRDGRYTFAQLGGSTAQPVKITLCRDATCANKSPFATVTADTYAAPAPTGVARPYFLVEREGATRIIGARRLALAGAYNFRDLGGIATESGKTIRWGQVFRSDALDKLTEADYKRLNAIGITLVCDLRTRQERQTSPTNWASASPMFLVVPVSESADGGARSSNLTNSLQSGKVTLEEGRAQFEQFYLQTVKDSAAKFGTALRAIASSSAPSMFHCQGGRDRTGITAALLMEILGVPRQTILNDYVVSNVYLNERPGGLASLTSAPDPKAAKLYADIIELQPRYIEAVFRGINKDFGSFERYRREALQVSDEDVARLKARLLQ